MAFCCQACWYWGCKRITSQLGSTVVAPYLLALGRELALISDRIAQWQRLAQLWES